MADAIKTKLQKVSGEYSAKVNDIRDLKEKKKKPFVTDAEVKTINEQIKVLERESKAAMAELNRLTELEKTAKEYIKINEDIKTLNSSLATADRRGEDTASIKRDINKATTRLRVIGPEVERSFPEIKVATPQAPSSVKPGPTGPTGPSAPTAQTPATGLTPSGAQNPPSGFVQRTPTTGTGLKKPKPGETPKVETAGDREATALGAASTTTDLALPETLFKNIPSLNTILKKFVNTPGMTEAAFLKLVRDDVWFKQNSKEIKNRYVQYYNYRDLQASGRAQGTTAYEMDIAKIEAKLKKRAVEIGSAAANDPAALRQAAENLYITNRSEDETFITDFLAASVKTMAGMIGGKVTQGYSGEALTNYDKLVEAARDNGFQVSDILPGATTEQQVIQGIISGNIDVNRVIADARKLAAQGQPEYVRDLLAQGYNLKQVFAPYRTVMANVLEIGDANQIDLNDPLLRSAITDKGDMNLYDFRKQLRQDNRWQYTAQAKEDVSTAALQVLRDFGFQG
jgi:hypothetical protein